LRIAGLRRIFLPFHHEDTKATKMINSGPPASGRHRGRDAGGPEPAQADSVWDRFDAILAQLDQIPEQPGSFDPLEWDENGLPR